MYDRPVRFSACSIPRDIRNVIVGFLLGTGLCFFWGLSHAAPARQAVSASRAPHVVRIHIFWSPTCPHCHRALGFLDGLEKSAADVRVIRHDVSGDAQARELFEKTVAHFRIANPGVPLIVVGNKTVLGFHEDATTGESLLQVVQDCRIWHCADALSADGGMPSELTRMRNDMQQTAIAPRRIVHLPVIGTVNWEHLSLPVLTVVLAAADGFNPCAMWVLVFLLGLLVGVQNRGRRFLLGGVFIATSALVYYLIMAAWLNTLLLFGYVMWLRLVIGLVALLAGGALLYNVMRHQENVCPVSTSPTRRAVLEKLKHFALSPNLPLGLAGIVLLAFAVNVVELLCSAGIPATYTQVLALKQLSTWQHLAYIGLYVLVFMLDDLVIFIAAMLAMEVTGLGARYARWSRLAGGLVLLVLGMLMIFKPEWLF